METKNSCRSHGSVHCCSFYRFGLIVSGLNGKSTCYRYTIINLDRGIVFVDVFMKVCFYPRLKHFIMQQVWNDPKSCLQQCCLTLRPEEGSPDLPEYKVIHNSGSVQKLRYKGPYFCIILPFFANRNFRLNFRFFM